MSAELHPYSSLPTTLPEAQALIAQLQQKLQWSELQRSALEEQLRLKRIEKYRAGSEKLSNLQLELLEEEPSVSQAEVEAESERPPLNGDTTEVVIHRKRKAKKHPGRQTLPPHLPRVEQVIVCPTEQCTCGVCGQEKLIIGYEESEHLDRASQVLRTGDQAREASLSLWSRWCGYGASREADHRKGIG